MDEEYLNLVKEYKKLKFHKYIKPYEIFKIDSLYMSVIGNNSKDQEVAIFTSLKDLFNELDIIYAMYSFSPDKYLRCSSYRVCLGNPKNLISKETKKSLLIKKDLTFRFDVASVPRIIREEESTLIKDVLRKLIKVAIFYINNEVKEINDFKYMYEFTLEKEEIKYKKLKFPKYFYDEIDIKPLNKKNIKKALSLPNFKEYNISLLIYPFIVESKNDKSYPYILIIEDLKREIILEPILIYKRDISNLGNILLDYFIKTDNTPQKMIFNDSFSSSLSRELLNKLDIKADIDLNMKNINEFWIEFKNYKK